MPTTTGTNTDEIWSANLAMAGLLLCAVRTMRMIRASIVFAPMPVASMTNPPSVFNVPADTCASCAFNTGTGSPVSIDSSMYDSP